MRIFWKRFVSVALLTVMIAATLASTLISASASEIELSADAQEASNAADGLMVGIDISGWQTSVNWPSVKSAGVEFAMFRLTSYSSASHSYVKDPMLDSHISGAKSQGIHIGGYFFSYAKSVDEVRNEANMVMDILKQYPETFNFPIVFDAESTNIQGFAADACVTFREILEANGYWVMIYANKNWFDNIITPASKISGCDLWQAYYPWTSGTQIEKYRGYTPTQAKSIDFNSRKALNNNNQHVYMWQFTQQSTVSGIGTNCVDMNICTRDYSQLIPAAGRNGFPPPQTHTHAYQAGNDTTHHYQICYGCGDRQSVVEHSYTAQYKNEAQHDMKCSCQYISQTVDHAFTYVSEGGSTHKLVCACGYEVTGVEHNFEYVSEEDTHKLVCACGYVKPDSQTQHKYDVITASGQARHDYSCICGAKKAGTSELHSYVTQRDENCHFNVCRKCGYVDETSETEHDFFIHKADREFHWMECVCGYQSDKGAHTSTTEKCADCGYHYHEPLFNDKEHWEVCRTCSTKKSPLPHWFDKEGNCKECGYKKGSDCEHESVTDGTCDECGYHEHPYTVNEVGHSTVCSCPQVTGAFEVHLLDEEAKCTVCGYDASLIGVDPDIDPDPDPEDTDIDIDTDTDTDTDESDTETDDGDSETKKKPSSNKDDDDEDEDLDIKLEYSGCESALGATAVVSFVAVFGCAFVFKKKEDN